jgi:acyl-coenzyme A synthetase/AMP-(fatty) acid ligase
MRGGINISPEEIEALLLGCPSIADAAVMGAPDTLMGEQVCAFGSPQLACRSHAPRGADRVLPSCWRQIVKIGEGVVMRSFRQRSRPRG